MGAELSSNTVLLTAAFLPELLLLLELCAFCLSASERIVELILIYQNKKMKEKRVIKLIDFIYWNTYQ